MIENNNNENDDDAVVDGENEEGKEKLSRATIQ